MKHDVEIIIHTNVIKGFIDGDKMTVAVDMDYCDDYDDVIQDIENTIWTKYGKSLHFNRDFEIDEDNSIKICDLFN